MSVTIKLSRVPPSLHRLYARGNGRQWKSKDYVSWQKYSQAEILLQGRPKFTKPVDVLILIPRAQVRASSDCDNRQKAVLDLLTAMQVIPDDSSKFVRSAKAEWADIEQTEIVITEITEAEAA